MPKQKIYKNCEICGESFWPKGKRKARFCSRQCFKKSMQGENNINWKGDQAGLDALHWWIRVRLPQPKLCQQCFLVEPYDLANISQQYKRDTKDWEWLCRKCHMTKDGRLKKFIEFEKPFLKSSRWKLHLQKIASLGGSAAATKAKKIHG
jgi:hypothetical protein